MSQPSTLRELRASGYRSKSVRAELRDNLLAALADPEGRRGLFPGIVGYDDSVIPELENAVLAGHHIVLLGERGQAKSRLIRQLVGLLDEFVPAVDGCEIHDDPFAPVCAPCRRRAAECGEELPVVWMSRDRRYGEKLATPDVSIADLIGEIDPVRIAEGRYLADEEAIHYGLVPRTHRGIFAINELPDLTEKVQVGLFNLMEERDLQIKGFKVRIPVDVVVVATANPEDYTNRGRIVTPLKDRFDAQIRTHYPATADEEAAIVELEVSMAEREGRPVRLTDFMKEIVVGLTFEARRAPEVSQGSGVSVRASISNFETLLANAEKRAVVTGEREIVPRISDLHALFPSTNGKLELEHAFEEDQDSEVFERLVAASVKAAFDRRVDVDSLQPIVDYFAEGWGVAVSDTMAAADYAEGVASIPGLRAAIDALGAFETPGLVAAAAEFLFEGLHVHERLNCSRDGGRVRFGS